MSFFFRKYTQTMLSQYLTRGCLPVSRPTLFVPGTNVTNYAPLFSCVCNKRLNLSFWSYQHRDNSSDDGASALQGHQSVSGSSRPNVCKSLVDPHVTDKLADYLSGLTQQSRVSSPLYPVIIRKLCTMTWHTFVFHCPTVDKVSLLFPIGGPSWAVSHKLYFGTFLCFSKSFLQSLHQVLGWKVEHVAITKFVMDLCFGKVTRRHSHYEHISPGKSVIMHSCPVFNSLTHLDEY